VTDRARPAWRSFRRAYWSVAAALGVAWLLVWSAASIEETHDLASMVEDRRAPLSAAPALASLPTPLPTSLPFPLPVPDVVPVAPPRDAPADLPAPSKAFAAAALPEAPLPATLRLRFADDGTALPLQGRKALRPVADYLRANAQAQAVVTGVHLSDRAQLARSWDLAVRRSEAIREALVRSGVARQRVVVREPAAQREGTHDVVVVAVR
jgi:outer membrane protein OmpA-like peptidoglycan-associated protein